MRIQIFLLLFAISTTQVLAKNSINIEMQTAQSVQEKQAALEIQDSRINQTVIQLVNDLLPFNTPVHIEYGDNDGPLYDTKKHTIYIPYRFYLESRDYFAKNDYEKKYGKPAKDGAIDTLLHTILHELGHAYIADQHIPILGKEEDAVDNFATILLLNYVDNGDDIAISAADMFAFESDDRPDYYDFGEYIDEHSFDLQRYFSTLCLVYGSDPKKYGYLLEEVEEDYLEERKDFCVFNYESINENWHSYFSNK